MINKAIIFDWGNTIMRDYKLPGPMYKWNKTDWVPGAEQLLEYLQGKYILIIATNAPHSGREEMIKALQPCGGIKILQRNSICSHILKIILHIFDSDHRFLGTE